MINSLRHDFAIILEWFIKNYIAFNPDKVSFPSSRFRGSFFGKITSCLKLVRVIIKTWNLVLRDTHTYVVSERIPFSKKTLLILLISAFVFTNNQQFLSKIAPLLKAIIWKMCYRLFSSVFSFCKRKGYC